MFHLYHSQELLKVGEIIAYEAGVAMTKYNVTPDLKPQAKGMDLDSPRVDLVGIEDQVSFEGLPNWKLM